MASADSPETGDDLQFDHAEFTTPTSAVVTCGVCKSPISDEYYSIEGVGTPLCANCRRGIEAARGGGSGVARFLSAAVLGLIAAATGAVAMYLVLVLTNIFLSLLTIAVGFYVGKYVQKGSGFRGGWVYQFLAVALTYSSVAWSHVPIFYKSLLEGVAQKEQLRQKEGAAMILDTMKANQAKEEQGTKKEPDDVEEPKAEIAPATLPMLPPRDVDLAGKTILFVASVAIAYVFPFLAIRQNPSSLLTILIIFFGLQQAWRMTRKMELTFLGPFHVGEGGTMTEGAPAHA